MEDTVRILRLIEYVGPRSWVERTIAKSITETSGRSQDGEWRIRGTTLGTYPDILEPQPKKEV